MMTMMRTMMVMLMARMTVTYGEGETSQRGERPLYTTIKYSLCPREATYLSLYTIAV